MKRTKRVASRKGTPRQRKAQSRRFLQRSLIVALLGIACVAGLAWYLNERAEEALADRLTERAAAMREAARQAGKFEFYRLDPRERRPTATAGADFFHGFRIIERRELTDPGRRLALMRALGMALQGEDAFAERFRPRYALRLEGRDEVLEAVVSFEDGVMEYYRGFQMERLQIGKDAEPVFAAIGSP